jgi:hypothetical protein
MSLTPYCPHLSVVNACDEERSRFPRRNRFGQSWVTGRLRELEVGGRQLWIGEWLGFTADEAKDPMQLIAIDVVIADT